MRTTIDKAGRLVVPKRLRDQIGLRPGDPLEVSARDGRIEIEVSPTPMRLTEIEGVAVAVADREMPVLTVEQVRETLEQVRR